MPVCWAAGCSNRTGSKQRTSLKDAYGENIAGDTKVRFLSFPWKNQTLLKQWVWNCGREGAFPSKESKICSVHFAEGSFEEDVFGQMMLTPGSRGRRHWSLKADAVPTLFKHRPASALRSTSVQRTQRRQRQELLAEVWVTVYCRRLSDIQQNIQVL